MLPLIIGFFVIADLLLVAFILARARLNDMKVPIRRDLFASGAPRKIMAIWAHPDDEITSAGTLSALTAAGADLTLVYLTAGEAARDTGYSRDELAKVRREEAKTAGALLGAHHVEVLDFPDSGLAATDPAAAKAAIAGLIERFQPGVIVSFDEQVGFYGHPDHVQTGRWVREVVDEGAPSVTKLYQATLPKALVSLALKLVQAFRDNYPTDPARGLPPATLAFPIARQAKTKRRLLDVHKSQAKIIADVQPYYDRVPAWLYYRLFDREYFTLAVDR